MIRDEDGEFRLKLTEKMAEDVTVLEAHGRLDCDSTTAKEFGNRLTALLQAGRREIVVDLTIIAYISSAGFQVLLIANRGTVENEGKLALCGVIGDVKRLFEISCLTGQFLVCHTQAEGIAKLSSPPLLGDQRACSA
jgi:anti-anti-sigma factor